MPLFHVNAWGVPYSTLMAGAKLVFPGPKMGDGEALYNRLSEAGITITVRPHHIRISPSVFNDMDDIERLIRSLA